MRILLIEDEVLIAMDAEISLRAAGHEVVGPYKTHEKAMEAARLEKPDVAMVDINLAGHNEGLAIARDLFDRFGVRSFFATGQASVARDNRGLAMGVLHKPYSAYDLTHAFPVLEAVMGGASPPPPKVPLGFELFG